jgi:glycosyltransferase involved in cell wall biosynthesis
MKLFFDNIIYTKSNNGGVSNYWFELTSYFLKQSEFETRFFESPTDLDNFHRKQLVIDNDKLISINRKSNIINRVLPLSYSSNEFFIYHSSYYRNLIGSKNKIEVSTIHDFTHDFFAPFINKKIHNHLKYNAIKRSKGLICISKNTYSNLKYFCPPKSNQKTEVIYNGVSDDYFNILNFNSVEEHFIKLLLPNNDFLLYVGSRANYKNFNYVISMLNNQSDLSLVVVGGGNFNKKELKLLEKLMQNNRITFISTLSNKELNILYNKAFAFIYPSFYEGFGLPLIEAMRAGCPIIALDNPINNEITEGNAVLLNDLSFLTFKNEIQKLKSLDYRNQLIENGFLFSKKYSWAKCCNETKEFYQSLIL